MPTDHCPALGKDHKYPEGQECEYGDGYYCEAYCPFVDNDEEFEQEDDYEPIFDFEEVE
jgi:hypothetical protein